MPVALTKSCIDKPNALPRHMLMESSVWEKIPLRHVHVELFTIVTNKRFGSQLKCEDAWTEHNVLPDY